MFKQTIKPSGFQHWAYYIIKEIIVIKKWYPGQAMTWHLMEIATNYLNISQITNVGKAAILET